MAKIFISIALLLQLCTIQGLSPCSKLFTYTVKPETNEIVGQIKIPSAPRDSARYYLKVGFNTNPSIHKKEPVAQLEIAPPIEETISAVQQGKPLLYHVHFPMGQGVPRLTKIWFNDQQLCPHSGETEFFTTTVEVEQVYPSKEPSLNVSKSHQELSVVFENMSHIIYFPEEIGVNNTFLRTLSERFPQYNNISNIDINNIDNSNNNECGISSYTDRANFLVVNGEETMPGQWPWLAALFAVRRNHEFKCGGSILTTKHVITAAHCLKLRFSNDTLHPNVLVVALGRFNLRQWREHGTVNREVASFKIHPDYTHTVTGDSDLAILTLRTSIEFSPFIRPICLWSGPTDVQNIVNKIGWVVGWGEDQFGHPYTEQPRMVRIPVISQETCLGNHQIFSRLISQRTFCAGLQDGIGPCNGDSGSGFVLFNATTSRYQLRGVVSRALLSANMSCDLMHYVVYVDVAKYIPWIQEQISTL